MRAKKTVRNGGLFLCPHGAYKSANRSEALIYYSFVTN